MMNSRLVGIAWSTALALVVGACSGAPPSGSSGTGSAAASVPASGPASPAASPSSALTYDAFVVAACSAFDLMDQAIGNPETGAGSKLSVELDQAVEAKDGPAATRLAAAIATKLAAGRAQAAVAAGYPSARPMMIQLDRLLEALSVMAAAKRDVATGVPGAVEPQAAFENAGGVDAWRAMIEALRAIERPAGVSERECPTVPISL